jgi:recombination protein RecA
MWGNPETTSGGNALKFYSSIRLDIRRIGSLKEKDKIIGNKVKVKIVKNKLAPPYKVIETSLIFGEGFSKAAEVLSMAHELDVVELEGSKYYYNDSLIAAGKAKAITALKKDKVLLKSIYADIKKAQKGENEA